jgi:hypothetical protein
MRESPTYQAGVRFLSPKWMSFDVVLEPADDVPLELVLLRV